MSAPRNRPSSRKPGIEIVPCGEDNYAYLIDVGDEVWAVDPGSASPVLETLGSRRLGAVFCTHHHRDHVGGLEELRRRFAAPVFGPLRAGGGGETSGPILEAGREKMTMIPTPGHTRDSVSYFLHPGPVSGSGALFTGDTLFLGGCGRLGECGPERMWNSLRLLAAGAGEVALYCGHEYTRENYRFAAAAGVAGSEALDFLEQLDRGPDTVSVPRTLEAEKRTNPFLRTREAEVRIPLGMAGASAFEVFVRLRRLKDAF